MEVARLAERLHARDRADRGALAEVVADGALPPSPSWPEPFSPAQRSLPLAVTTQVLRSLVASAPASVRATPAMAPPVALAAEGNACEQGRREGNRWTKAGTHGRDSTDPYEQG